MKRQLDVVVISDVHLGSNACKAEALEKYLKSIEPKILILNGDIIEGTHLKKGFFPKSHLQVIQRIIQFAINGCKVYYITGKEDHALRKFSGHSLGKINLRDKLILQIQSEKYWIIHGSDIEPDGYVSLKVGYFDKKGYALLENFNRWLKVFRKTQAGNKDKAFEHKALDRARKQKYDHVICGHTHKPALRTTHHNGKRVTYMNAGDWVENQTALEYHNHTWTLHRFDEKKANLSENSNKSSRDINEALVDLMAGNEMKELLD